MRLTDWFVALWLFIFCFFFFKQKTAYEVRISDWSSDVCSSDLLEGRRFPGLKFRQRLLNLLARIAGRQGPRDIQAVAHLASEQGMDGQIGRASCRDRVCQYV